MGFQLLPPGKYTFRFTIDPGNRIPETNELNNQVVVRDVYIGTGVFAGPPKPAPRKQAENLAAKRPTD